MMPLAYIYCFHKQLIAYMSFSERLKSARTRKGLSQSQLGQLVNLHYTQIGRYENKGAQPSADVLSKLADALDVTTDFLMYGSREDVAEGIGDKELISQFKKIALLPTDQKNIVKELIDAFLLKNDLQQKLSH